MGFCFCRPGVFLVLILLICSYTSQDKLGAAARPIRLLSQQGYSKLSATLGMVCKCCDGADGGCRSTWGGSCSNLKCIPWKLH